MSIHIEGVKKLVRAYVSCPVCESHVYQREKENPDEFYTRARDHINSPILPIDEEDPLCVGLVLRKKKGIREGNLFIFRDPHIDNFPREEIVHAKNYQADPYEFGPSRGDLRPTGTSEQTYSITFATDFKNGFWGILTPDELNRLKEAYEAAKKLEEKETHKFFPIETNQLVRITPEIARLEELARTH